MSYEIPSSRMPFVPSANTAEPRVQAAEARDADARSQGAADKASFGEMMRARQSEAQGTAQTANNEPASDAVPVTQASEPSKDTPIQTNAAQTDQATTQTSTLVQDATAVVDTKTDPAPDLSVKGTPVLVIHHILAKSPALTDAVDALKAAVKAAMGEATASADSSTTEAATQTPTTETDAKASADANTLTDAQLNGVMQALLSGKPLSPDMQQLAQKPEVAAALQAVRTQFDATLKATGLDQAANLTPDMAVAASLAKPVLKGDAVITPTASDLKVDTVIATDAEAETASVEPLRDRRTPLGKAGLPSQASTQIAKTTEVTQDAAPTTAKAATDALQQSPDAVSAATTPVRNHEAAPAFAAPQAATADGLKLTQAPLTSTLSTSTVQNMAAMSAQITRHLSSNKSTEFNMELHPADMGRVDVKLSIAHDGTLSAALSFDSPVAESQFRAQADELRRQLEAQGFQVAEGALSFSARDGSGGQNAQSQNQAAQTFAGASDDRTDTGTASRAAQAFGGVETLADAAGPGAALAQKLGLTLLGGQTYRLSLNVTA